MQLHYKKNSISEDGSALIEFALVAPIFLLLITSLFTIGLILHSKILLVTAVSEACHQAAYIQNENLSEEEKIKNIEETFYFITNNGVSRKDSFVELKYEDGYVYTRGEYHFIIPLPLVNQFFEEDAVVLVEEVRAYLH